MLDVPDCRPKQNAREHQASVTASLFWSGDVTDNSSTWKRRWIRLLTAARSRRHTKSYHRRTSCRREATQHKERCIRGRGYRSQANLHSGEQSQTANIYRPKQWGRRIVVRRIIINRPASVGVCNRTPETGSLHLSRQKRPRHEHE